jgi:mRNA interferase RelE/StbE
LTYIVKVAPRAERQIKKLFKSLPPVLARKLGQAIDALGDTPRPQNIKKLEDATDIYRIDVQDYRIVYSIQDKELIILILKVAHRKEIYSKKLK